ncbi:hypothetical protein HFO99_01025 [Rhizobium leguminosarum]|nr:hypothetical protein [Rhizobium leguminosarum]
MAVELGYDARRPVEPTECFNLTRKGSSGWHEGEPPDRRSIATTKNHGIDISGQRARRVQPLHNSLNRHRFKDAIMQQFKVLQRPLRV